MCNRRQKKMSYKVIVKPVHREEYLNRCRVLRQALDGTIPASIIVEECLGVLTGAFGSKVNVLRWLVLQIIHDLWERITEKVLFVWLYHIRQLSGEEIDELSNGRLYEETGVDFREW